MKAHNFFFFRPLLFILVIATVSCSEDSINDSSNSLVIKSSENPTFTFDMGDIKVIHHNSMNELYINEELFGDFEYEDINALMINEQVGDDFFTFQNQFTGDHFKLENIVVEDINNRITFDFYLNDNLLGIANITSDVDIVLTNPDELFSRCGWVCVFIEDIINDIKDMVKEITDTVRSGNGADVCTTGATACSNSGGRPCMNYTPDGTCIFRCKDPSGNNSQGD